MSDLQAHAKRLPSCYIVGWVRHNQINARTVREFHDAHNAAYYAHQQKSCQRLGYSLPEFRTIGRVYLKPGV